MNDLCKYCDLLFQGIEPVIGALPDDRNGSVLQHFFGLLDRLEE